MGDGQWSALDGFGPEMEKALNSFDFSIAKEVEPYLTFEKIVIKNEDITLKGLTFCVTGKLKEFKNRDAIKSYIEDLGGKVTGSVSGNTNYLINNDINSTSAKNKTAQKLGIPIITEEQLKKMIDN